MPFKWIDSEAKNQCKAQAKSTRQTCLNPAAYGCKTCRVHGARKQNSIKRGEEHPNYRHGMETLQKKRQRSSKLSELREIENDLHSGGLIRGNRTAGRKPKCQNIQVKF